MRGIRLAAIAAVLAVGLFSAACSSGGDEDGSGDATSGSADAAITIQNFAFNPDTISGSAGTTITIAISNKDSVEHSFTLNDDSVSKDFEGGDGATVRVTLPDSGTVGWHCEYHPKTMKGTITVT
jgi:plastocyanin